MTQVTPASDIWSVGCLIIELLTGYPPYYDLQPMSALFRIVQVRCEPQQHMRAGAHAGAAAFRKGFLTTRCEQQQQQQQALHSTLSFRADS